MSDTAPDPTSAPPSSAPPSSGPTTGLALEPVAVRELLDELAALVLGVDAVVRLEPTIRTRLRQLSADPVTAIGSGTNPPDGVALRRLGQQLDATVEVAVVPTRPAAEIATEIRHRVGALIAASGWQPGTITVSVLAIERPAA